MYSWEANRTAVITLGYPESISLYFLKIIDDRNVSFNRNLLCHFTVYRTRIHTLKIRESCASVNLESAGTARLLTQFQSYANSKRPKNNEIVFLNARQNFLAGILTLLLTRWSRVLLEKLTGSQLVKKLPAFYWTWSFSTAFASARHLSLSWAVSI